MVFGVEEVLAAFHRLGQLVIEDGRLGVVLLDIRNEGLELGLLLLREQDGGDAGQGGLLARVDGAGLVQFGQGGLDVAGEQVQIGLQPQRLGQARVDFEGLLGVEIGVLGLEALQSGGPLAARTSAARGLIARARSKARWAAALLYFSWKRRPASYSPGQKCLSFLTASPQMSLRMNSILIGQVVIAGPLQARQADQRAARPDR